MKTTTPNSPSRSQVRRASFLIALAAVSAWVSFTPATTLAIDQAVDGRHQSLRQVLLRTVYENAKLTASDGEKLDQFGYSVSISGNFALVAAENDDQGRGSAYVFAFDGATWSQQAELSDLGHSEGFGTHVLLSGRRALISAATFKQNVVYVFTLLQDQWMQQGRLIGSDSTAGDVFNSSLAVSGKTVLVGATLADSGNDTNTGAVYVFSLARQQ